VAQSLGNPVLQQAPPQLGRIAAVLAGVALPLALHRVIGPGQILLGGALVGVLAGAIFLASLHGRAEGWKLSVVVLTAFILYSVTR
jgi:PTS system mannose-specific IID component